MLPGDRAQERRSRVDGASSASSARFHELSWTSARHALANTVAGGRGGRAMRRTAPAWGLVQFGREVFCPRRPQEVIKPWRARTFAAAELGARTLDPKGDAYYGSWGS